MSTKIDLILAGVNEIKEAIGCASKKQPTEKPEPGKHEDPRNGPVPTASFYKIKDLLHEGSEEVMIAIKEGVELTIRPGKPHEKPNITLLTQRRPGDPWHPSIIL